MSRIKEWLPIAALAGHFPRLPPAGPAPSGNIFLRGELRRCGLCKAIKRHIDFIEKHGGLPQNDCNDCRALSTRSIQRPAWDGEVRAHEAMR